MKKLKRIMIIGSIIICAIVIVLGIIEITYKNIVDMECCECNDDGSMTNCVGDIQTNCIECCACNYDLIKRITVIYNYYIK